MGSTTVAPSRGACTCTQSLDVNVMLLMSRFGNIPWFDTFRLMLWGIAAKEIPCMYK
jgi:hypothetical protein